MADEATVQCSLNIQVGELSYQSFPQSFQADVSDYGAAGPTPGRVQATLAGATVDLSKIVNEGGLGRVQNLDPTNFVILGSFDASTSRFTPWFDLLPGESFPLRLSRYFGNEFGAGTGTASSDVTLQVRVDPSQATGTTAWVLCEFFDR